LGSIFCLLLLCDGAAANAADSAESHCRAAIQTGLSRWTLENVKTRIGCEADVIFGVAQNIDCATGDGSGAVALRYQLAADELRSRLESACSGANFGLLSYPGPCSGEASPFTSNSLAHCIMTVGQSTIDSLFQVWYPSDVTATRGSASRCMMKVPKRAASMVLAETGLRLHCLLDQELSGSSTNVDCRAQLPPYGLGTGNAVLDTGIIHAQLAWLGGLPRVCARADFASIGYGEHCIDPLDSGSELIDFHACVFQANRLTVPAFLDLAFPSTPVCGNGIKQEGEQCDQGLANSDTKPDACRIDCTLPVCGDGVTDPGNHESCDDGNTASLDGCDSSCNAEICGDGIVNNLPNEQCDDKNTNDHDNCTNGCKAAVCGDGIVCNDPSCTSGPGGGPEQCDQGSKNSDTGICHTDCSGFTRVCTLTIGVTTNADVGALTYEMSYADASGELAGSGSHVQCTSAVSSGLTSFNDNDASRFLKESMIVDAGVHTPASIATCTFATNDANLAASQFSFTIDAESDPSFNPIDVTMAVTNLSCQ
jgi:cysteine-rich repeat protein